MWGLFPRHCEAHRAEATQGNIRSGSRQATGLLRFARNDASITSKAHAPLIFRAQALTMVVKQTTNDQETSRELQTL